MQLNQEAISCEEADCSCEENKCIFDLESIYDAPLPAREISLIDITPRSITVYETDPRQRIMSETIVTDNGKLAVQVSNLDNEKKVNFFGNVRLGPILMYFIPLNVEKSEISLSEVNSDKEIIATIDPSKYNLVKTIDYKTYLQIDEDVYRDGRQLMVNFSNDLKITKDFRLAFAPVEGSVKVKWNGQACEDSKEEYVEISAVDPTVLSTFCPGLEASSSELKVDIEYRYKGDKNSFQVSEVNPEEEGLWEVYVNGTKTGDFSREGNVIILNNKLDKESKVKVRYTKP